MCRMSMVGPWSAVSERWQGDAHSTAWPESFVAVL